MTHRSGGCQPSFAKVDPYGETGPGAAGAAALGASS
jgi:hypothetical protein